MNAMRSIWKGSLAFGLVNVPVKVYSATEDHDVRFHQVHAADGGRIKYQRICEVDGKVVEYADIAKAYESDDGRTVVLTDEDFEQLPANSGHEIEVLQFVPADQLDPVLFDRSYYLEPDGRSVKAYVLLRKALDKTERVAIVHFALRQKTRLAALRIRDDVLMVQTLLWPDEVRAADFDALSGKVSVTAAELKMAASLIDSLSGEFDPDEYDDEYREQLEKLIAAKLEGGEAFPTEQSTAEEPQDAEVVDLLAALRRSVDTHKKAGRSTSKAGSTAEKTGTASKKSGTAGSTTGSKARSSSTRTTSKKSATGSSTGRSKPGGRSTASKSTKSKSA